MEHTLPRNVYLTTYSNEDMLPGALVACGLLESSLSGTNMNHPTRGIILLYIVDPATNGHC